ncbi:phage tail protein [Streptomyces sp. NPDC057620]|uniref:phage tail protein n=1 Tax=Streptomyces sp. NPDC057620 TaxID=3346185 RepID=UPI0036B10549
MSDDVTITVRVNNQTAAGFRDVNGQLRDLQGRFATAGGDMQRSSNGVTKAVAGMRATLLSLAPAAIPVAASMAPIALQAGAAGVALGAFGAAVAPQVKALGELSSAQAAAQQSMRQIPQATQRAAASFASLRVSFQAWSDSTAKFTMAPVEKSFAVMEAVLPRLTPMVEGASGQLDRLMTVAGGAVNSSAFDALSERVGDFANNTLKSATDRAISFARALSEGNGTGPLSSFMDYARENGPAVKDFLTSATEAVSTLVEGAAQAGPGLLTLVTAVAKLVASLPPEFVGTLMQAYAAFKLISLVGAGVTAAGAAYATLAARVTALRAASVAAGGGIAGMNAALNTMSTGGKAALALGVVGALALAMHKLSDNKGPVAVDELSSSLNTLASTGKVTGALKTNFEEMSKSIAMVSKGASDNKIATMVSDFGSWVGIAEGPGISTAKKNVDAWDKSMANLVRAGHTKEAAKQYDILKKAWVAGGGDVKRLKETTNDYNNALADSKFEAKMLADSMGLFGQAAQSAQAKLTAQKAAADGLRQSIEALNDANRSALGGMIGFEASIDNAAKAAKENAGSLNMVNGVLDVNSPKAQAAATALNDLASKTKDAALANREATGSWEGAVGIYDRGRSSLMKYAQAMGLSKSEATTLADQILKIPDKKMQLKMDKEDAEAGLRSFNAAVKKTPGAKSVTLKTLSQGAEQILESFGLKVKRLPDGKVKITAANGQALKGVGSVQAALARLPKSRTINITIKHFTQKTQRIITEYQTRYLSGRSQHDIVGATGGLFTGNAFKHGYADGGTVRGPGTGTSDDVFAPWLSNGEFVMKKAAVDRYGEKFMQLINAGRLDMPKFAKGGSVTKSEREARNAARGDLTISHFGQIAGYKNSEIRNDLGSPDSLGSLVSSLNQWRSSIMKSTHGGQERSLLRTLDSYGKSLIKHERNLATVNKSLEKAKTKLDDLKNSASQLRDSVKSGVLGSANITKGANGDAPVTVASVMGGLTRSRDQAKSFSSALAALQKKGLDKGLIEEIAQAGIDGGGLETAGALMSASKSEIKSLNTLRSQTSTYASAAGKTAADAMYGKAIASQEKLVKSLTKQQDKLEKAMDKLAKAMEKAIEKAYGKKAAGGIVGAAASGGMRGGLTWVGEHEPELLDLPVGSRVWSGPDSRRKAAAPWASMLNAPQSGRRGGRAVGVPASGGDGGRPIVLHVSFGAKEFGQIWVDAGRKEVKVRGGLKATLGGMD